MLRLIYYEVNFLGEYTSVFNNFNRKPEKKCEIICENLNSGKLNLTKYIAFAEGTNK